MRQLMLATTNPGKAAELRGILGLHLDLTGLTLLTPRDWPGHLPNVEESGATFAENARLKATALAEATGLAALADDSGLCVDALDGAPGLYSARWAGENATDADRNAKLLAALASVPGDARTARFVCAVTLAFPEGKTVTAEGACEGSILEEARGTDGFGYDPLFLLAHGNLSMAQLPADEKNLCSHRALAVTRLAPDLRRLLLTV